MCRVSSRRVRRGKKGLWRRKLAGGKKRRVEVRGMKWEWRGYVRWVVEESVAVGGDVPGADVGHPGGF